MSKYEMRVRAMEDQGMTRSDAQSVIEAEDMIAARKEKADEKFVEDCYNAQYDESMML
jgi:hypothetical protein